MSLKVSCVQNFLQSLWTFLCADIFQFSYHTFLVIVNSEAHFRGVYCLHLILVLSLP